MMRRFFTSSPCLFTYPFLFLISFIGLLPFYWMVSCSFKTNETMFLMPLQWLPHPVNWNAYGDAWKAQDFTRYFLNTAFVATAITVGNLLLASLAGYSLSQVPLLLDGGSLFPPHPQHDDAASKSRWCPSSSSSRSSTGPIPTRD